MEKEMEMRKRGGGRHGRTEGRMEKEMEMRKGERGDTEQQRGGWRRRWR